jgi:N-acetylglucosaminyl-diphospho-decaprenol L-rhamnosyltransferase
MRAEVLIPHHGGRERLRRALGSLRRQSVEPSVCVIDNGSEDGSREMLAVDHAAVRVVELEANRGFGAAVNAGARTSEAGTVCLLNNDAEADERFVEELLAVAERTGAEAVAGLLRLADGTIDTAGVEVDQSLVPYDHLHGESYPQPSDVAAPLGPSGGAAAYDRESFLRLGGFDEEFFAYLEDVDLAIRMRRAGMRCAIAPGAFAWHRHAGTLGPGSGGKNRLLGRGRGRLLWKHGAALPARDRARGAFVDAVTYGGQIALDRNAGAVRGRLEERRAHRDRDRPQAAGLDDLPVLRLSALESLRRRWGRGRRYRDGRR